MLASCARLGAAVGALAPMAGACSWPTVGHGPDRSARGTEHRDHRCEHRDAARGVALRGRGRGEPAGGRRRQGLRDHEPDRRDEDRDALGVRRAGCDEVLRHRLPAVCTSTWSYTYPPIKPPSVPSTPTGPYLSPPTVDGSTVDVGVVQYGIFENFTWTDARSVTDGAPIRQIGSQFGGRVSSVVVGDTLVTSGDPHDGGEPSGVRSWSTTWLPTTP